jgi:hypothetical protein
MFGKNGDDRLFAATATTTSTARTTMTSCHGGPGDDILAGRNDDDRIFGDAGDDRITGDRGDDEIDGGDGDDQIFGNLDFDSVRGGRGRDRINVVAVGSTPSTAGWAAMSFRRPGRPRGPLVRGRPPLGDAQAALAQASAPGPRALAAG